MLVKPGPAMRRAAAKVRRKPRFAHDVSGRGLEFIGRFEGCPLNQDGTLRVYNDSVGYATVGIGRLLHYSGYTPADVAKYRGYRYRDALDMLHQDVRRFVAAVNSLGLKLAQNEMDALVSFSYNCGTGSLNGGVAANLRRGDKQAAMAVLQQYDHAGGQVVYGLQRRRAAEAALFLHGTYQ